MKTKIFLLVAAFLFSLFNCYSQNKDCKYFMDKIDEFSKMREVRTKAQIIFDNKGAAFASDVLLGGGSIRANLSVLGAYNAGKKYLGFSTADKSNYEDYDRLELLLANDSVVALEKDDTKFETGQGEDIWYLFTVPDLLWDKLKQTPIKKIRFLNVLGSSGNSVSLGTVEIGKKFVNNISNVISCIDILNLPNVETKTTDDEPGISLKKEANNAEMPKPTGDTIGISIYKQWKVKVSIGKDGIPSSYQGTQFIQFNKDGTFTHINVSPAKTKIVTNGKFELMNEGKIIILYYQEGSSSSAAIMKLTNKELEIKGEYQIFYTVF